MQDSHHHIKPLNYARVDINVVHAENLITLAVAIKLPTPRLRTCLLVGHSSFITNFPLKAGMRWGSIVPIATNHRGLPHSLSLVIDGLSLDSHLDP